MPSISHQLFVSVLSFEIMNLTDSQSLTLLPENVVFEIFKFLSLPERKHARLVCKQWHRVSNRRRFAENEAFFISNMYEIRKAVEVLVKCQRKMLNLKFNQRTFNQSSNILWSRCGHRIQSLEFDLCRFSQDIIKRIFLKCKNLNEFSSNGGGIEGCYPVKETLPRKKSILQIGDDVVRPKLRILQLKSLALSLRECDLRLISSAFPQLNCLNIQLLLSEDDVSVIHDSPNFIVLVNLLNSELKNLEKLHVEFPFCLQMEPIDFSSIPQFNCDRLKDVSTTLKPFILAGDSWNKILHYKFWTSLRISSCYLSDAPDMITIARLINENPLLKELDTYITFSCCLDFCNFFETLVKSRLKSLKISMSDNNISPQLAKLFISTVTPSFQGLPCNNTVEYLSVYSSGSAEFGDLFLQYFRSVQDLSMKPCNVNTIFKYQENLKSLEIDSLLVIPTDEPPVRRSIEGLELIKIQPLKLDLFTMYQFPNLKYLIVKDSSVYYDTMRKFEREYSNEPADVDGNEETNNGATDHNDSKEEFVRKINNLMSTLFQKSPHLEGIQFGSDYLLNIETFTVFLQSCLGFHQLRYVSFGSYSPDIDKMALKREVEKYFKKCPSFRGFWFTNLMFCLSFYFNIVTKEYEFCNEFSSGSSEHILSEENLYAFWRNKR